MRFCRSSTPFHLGVRVELICREPWAVRHRAVCRARSLTRRGSQRCRAFTLLEVVVGLTLMASVLVGSLLAFASHQRQRRDAEAKLAAVATAEQLLIDFSGQREGMPTRGQGPIAGRPGWYWRTGIVGTVAPAQVPLKVIRLEVIDVDREGSLRSLVSVDVVEPIEK